MIQITSMGDAARVTFGRDEVADFKSRWPCNGLPDRAIYFEFARNGDLIDTNISRQADGGAQQALCDDAKVLWRAHQHMMVRRKSN